MSQHHSLSIGFKKPRPILLLPKDILVAEVYQDFKWSRLYHPINLLCKSWQEKIAIFFSKTFIQTNNLLKSHCTNLTGPYKRTQTVAFLFYCRGATVEECRSRRGMRVVYPGALLLRRRGRRGRRSYSGLPRHSSTGEQYDRT